MVVIVFFVGIYCFLSLIVNWFYVWEMGLCIDMGGVDCLLVIDNLVLMEMMGLMYIKYVWC